MTDPVVGSQQKIPSKPQQPHSKTTVWRKFEIDRQNNQENQQRVLGQGKIHFYRQRIRIYKATV